MSLQDDDLQDDGERFKIARDFHDTYERLAPQFGYETRKDTKQFDPNSPNGKLMQAVCKEVVDRATAKMREELNEWILLATKPTHLAAALLAAFAEQPSAPTADVIAGITTGAIQRTLDQTFNESARESVKTIIHEALAQVHAQPSATTVDVEKAIFATARQLGITSSDDFVILRRLLAQVRAPLVEELELAWGIIANASGGDWSKESQEWQGAAAGWRDRVLPWLAHEIAEEIRRTQASENIGKEMWKKFDGNGRERDKP